MSGRNEAHGAEPSIASQPWTAADLQPHEREEQYRTIFEATEDGLLILDMRGTIVEVNPAYCQMHGYARGELIGMHLTELIAPEYRHRIPRDLSTIQAVGTTYKHLPVIRKDGSLFYAEARGRSFLFKGEPHVLVVVRDVTDRVQAYELLEQRVSERTRELTALLDVARTVTSTLDLQHLLGLILDQLKVVADYDGAGIVVLRDGLLRVIGYRGPIPQEYAMQASFPADGALVWELLKQREPVVIDDVRADTPLAQEWRKAVSEELDRTYAFIRCWMAVPLTLQDRVIGGLTLESTQVSAYTAHHASIAVAIAQQAAIAIENANLYQQAQKTAVLEERHRLSRELHDSVSQALYSIALGARTARTLLDRDPTRMADPLDFVLSQAERGLAEMRALIFELRPDALEQDGLVTALERQADLVRTRHMIAVDLTLCSEPNVSLPAKEALYRVAQEALHNVVKHATARHICLSLSIEGDDLVLRIQDDGAGFDVSSDFPGHYGLISMQERAAVLHGAVHIQSAPGRGTTVCATLPLAPRNNPAQL